MDMKSIIEIVLKEAKWIKSAGKITSWWTLKNGNMGYGAKNLDIYVEKVADDVYNVSLMRTKADMVKLILSDLDKYFEPSGLKLYQYTIEYLKDNPDAAKRIIDRRVKHLIKYRPNHVEDFKYKPDEEEMHVKKKFNRLNKFKLFDLLVSKSKLNVDTFEKYYGSMEGQSTERTERFKHKNWDIFFDVKTKREHKDLTDLLDDAEKALKSKGQGHLVGGRVMAVDSLGGRTLADYEPNGDLIRIGFKQLQKGTGRDNKRSLLHELGHRNWYRFLDRDKKTAVVIKFNDVSSGGVSTDVKRGDILINTQTGDKFEITNKEYVRTLKYVGELKEIGEKSRMKEKDLNKKYNIPSKYVGTVLVPEKEGSASSYVPNSYALKNYGEFYAVLFAEFSGGNLKDPAKSWMEEIHK